LADDDLHRHAIKNLDSFRTTSELVENAAITTAVPSAVQRSHRDHRCAAGPAVRAAAMPTIVARRDAVITSNPNIVGLPAGAVRD
jgi:hypothetical protein